PRVTERSSGGVMGPCPRWMFSAGRLGRAGWFQLVESLAPFRGLVRLAGAVIELHQAAKRFLEPLPADRSGDLVLAFLHPLVAPEQQRLGLGVLLLAEEGLSERGPRVKRPPVLRLRLLADGQAFLQRGFGLG